jgi:hypothetical protein
MVMMMIMMMMMMMIMMMIIIIIIMMMVQAKRATLLNVGQYISKNLNVPFTIMIVSYFYAYHNETS